MSYVGVNRRLNTVCFARGAGFLTPKGSFLYTPSRRCGGYWSAHRRLNLRCRQCNIIDAELIEQTIPAAVPSSPVANDIGVRCRHWCPARRRGRSYRLRNTVHIDARCIGRRRRVIHHGQVMPGIETRSRNRPTPAAARPHPYVPIHSSCFIIVEEFYFRSAHALVEDPAKIAPA